MLRASDATAAAAFIRIPSASPWKSWHQAAAATAAAAAEYPHPGMPRGPGRMECGDSPRGVGHPAGGEGGDSGWEQEEGGRGVGGGGGGGEVRYGGCW